MNFLMNRMYVNDFLRTQFEKIILLSLQKKIKLRRSGGMRSQ